MPFPYIEITDSSARYALAFSLGLAQVALGVVQIVRGFKQMNQTAVSCSLTIVVDGTEEIYNVIRARERSWEGVTKQMFSVFSLLVLHVIFERLVKHRQGERM